MLVGGFTKNFGSAQSSQTWSRTTGHCSISFVDILLDDEVMIIMLKGDLGIFYDASLVEL